MIALIATFIFIAHPCLYAHRNYSIEARALVLKAGSQPSIQWVSLGAEDAEWGKGGPRDSWAFRVFATNGKPPNSSLVGWYAVNKHTAVLTDPTGDAPTPIALPADEQARLPQFIVQTDPHPLGDFLESFQWGLG